ncbi:hypothetical protein ILUMI_25097 [Ignelater luminosus]|uniref:DUF4485 domain-containing protein n=1 Tax=Ignelater luminosus TaxID=2038154 RepID=A0A8K0C920_IGNLU|nr:hypothetical protein ILUMI_25097 [Ignelater luminosus]
MANPLQSLNENFFYNSMLARALVQLLPANDRPNFRYWLYKLHEINGPPEQMSIRNDYMWFMLLMLQSKRITEPFKNEPTQGELKPLRNVLPPKIYEEILTCSDQNMSWLEQAGDTLNLTELEKAQDPPSSPPAQFLDNQPVPRDGIICYMAAFSDHDY